MFLSQRPADLHEFGPCEEQTAPLQAGNYLTHETALHPVGLDQYQRAFHLYLPIN
jgi:hypothetical protein